MSSLQTTNFSTDLSDGRVGRPGGDEGHGGGGGVVGDHGLLDLLLHVGDVAEGAHRAHALEDGAAGDQPGVAVVDDQRLVHVHGQLLLDGGRAVGLHGAQGRVVLRPRHRADLKLEEGELWC